MDNARFFAACGTACVIALSAVAMVRRPAEVRIVRVPDVQPAPVVPPPPMPVIVTQPAPPVIVTQPTPPIVPVEPVPAPPVMPDEPVPSPRSVRAPRTLRVCETNTATLCASWVRGRDGIYRAEWQQGSVAEIRVTRFDRHSVEFVRDDPAGTSAGMHAVYRGIRNGNAVDAGQVTWQRHDETITGSWTASW